MIDNFEKHLTFYHSKNASLIAIGVGFDDSFLAWLLLNLFSMNKDPIWSMASTNIIMLDIPINKWSFNQVVGKLCKALQSNIHPTAEAPAQAALNATMSKTNSNRYSGPPCTYPGCHVPKTHLTDKCWIKEREREQKKRGRIKNIGRKRRKRRLSKAAWNQSQAQTRQIQTCQIQTRNRGKRNTTMLTGCKLILTRHCKS